jgi:hypothetical protein
MGPATVLKAPNCGSGAHRPTRVWQSLLPKETLDEAYSNLPVPSSTVNDMLALAGLGSRQMPPGDTSHSTTTHPTALPRFGTRPSPQPRATSPHATTNGLLVHGGTLTSPSPEVREVLLGFTNGDTEAGELSPSQRIHILGQCTDLHILHWTLAQASTASSENRDSHPREHPGIPWQHTYTFSQPLPDLNEAHTLPNGDTQRLRAPTMATTPPNYIPWTPRFLPEEWIYTDGSDIKGHPRLGAAMVHIPPRTPIYIDATGCEETRTILRAELVTIHTALTRFEDHPWIGIFTDSLSSLRAIRLHYYKPGLATAPHYHHHMFLLQSITNLLETRRKKGYSTSL